MRSVPVLIFFGLFVVLIQSRPSQTDENNESDIEETEYESDADVKAVAVDSIDENSSLNEDPASETDQSGRYLEPIKVTYEQRNQDEKHADRSYPGVSDNKHYGNREIRNDKVEETEDVQNYAKRRQSGRYIENKDLTDMQEAEQHLANRNVNYLKSDRIHNSLLFEDPLNNREGSSNLNEQGEMLFGNDGQSRDQPIKDKNNIDSEPLELNQHYSKYYNQMHPENMELQCKNRQGHLFINRDRRETKNDDENTASNPEPDKEGLDNQQSEDEETAIRRHIKKLSSEELQELLSSLPEEKRTLLTDIIDDTDLTVNSSDVNKREITKKAGTVEENTCVESGHADSSNIESAAALVISTTTGGNTDSPNMKSTETDTLNASNVGGQKTQTELAPNENVLTKNGNQKDTNVDDLADIVSFKDPKLLDNDWISGDSKNQGYFGSNDDDLSQFLDEEEAGSNDGTNQIYKRDVEEQAAYDSKIKSLEESFPKSENYDESAGPLIRVKRKNSDTVLKKRSAAVLPDAKVAFFPYRAESSDEDNDEGNEFDDDGFYDRTPNFSNNDANSNQDNLNCKWKEYSPHDSKETLSLGSDTDSVLSGVEGSNDNLMFNSGSRNRRTSEDISDIDESNAIQAQKSLNDENKAVSDMNVLTYQESDSFGPLPRNKEGESGRYKRIRRVKQSHPESAPDS